MVVILILAPNAPSPLSDDGYVTNTTVSCSSGSQAPHETFSTTKEEEWVTKKKKELTTTRQIETRIQRQVVLEDGKVVEDTGPLVTSNTTEDTETQDSQTTEHRTTEGPPSQNLALEGNGEGAGAPLEMREVRQHTVTSRQQTDERVETEQVTHNGDFSDEAFRAAVQASLLDLRAALRSPELQALTPAVSQPKIVHQSTRTSKVVDTEDSVETSEVQPDGRVVTETRRTQEHEEVAEHSEPEDEADGGGGGKAKEQSGLSLTADDHESVREASHHFRKTKDQQFVEYLADGVKVGEEMRFEAETAEGERRGDAGLLDHDWDSLSARMRRMRREGGSRNSPHGRAPAHGLERKDALTKKPLDLEEEEETRKVETFKWLEHHFGSDSRSSRGSLEDEVDAPTTSPPYNSFINVTMKSRPIAKTPVAASPSPTPLLNGSSVTTPKFVTSASRVFVSSPEPDEPPPPPPPANGYFQGVTEWSERNHCTTTRELDTSTHRADRVQVLPAGPHHTFTPKHVNYSEKTAVFKTSSGGANSRSSPYPSSLACPDRSLSYTNGSPGRTSPAVAPALPLDSHNSQSTYEHRREYEYHRSHSPYNDRSSPYIHQQSGRTPPLLPNGRDTPGASGSARDEDGLLRTSRRPRSPPRTPPRSPSRNHRYSHRREREGEDSLDGYRGSGAGGGGGGGVRWEREWERERGRGRGEPRPDYSPARVSISPSASPSPSPPPSPSQSPSPERGTGGRRVYRRPRVDLDLPSAASPPPPQPPPPEKKHGGIGESFRRLVGRFRASSAERKRRKAAAQAATAAAAASAGSGRRSPSPPQRRGARRASDRGGDEDMEGDRGPVAPPRSHRANKEQQRSARAASSHTQLSHHSDGHAGSGINMHGSGGVGGGQAQQRRFYLGEDPFGGSIYGREREYDGVKPVRRTRGGQRHGQRRASREEDDMNRANVSVTSSNSLGRLSKSTSRLASGGALGGGGGGGGLTGRASPLHAPVTDYTRNAQTLPRKLYDEHSSRLKRQVYQQQQLQRNAQSSSSPSNKALSHSMINVSIINNVTPPHSGTFTKVTNGVHGSTGPAKPARTYRTNLSRSKSFNVHTLGDPVDSSSPFLPKNESSGLNKSTSHLHRLDESPPPLKSPSILASISRSQRDLSSATESFEKEDSFASRIRYEPPKFSSSASNLLSNGYKPPSPITTSATTTTSSHDAKKRLFMRELMERAPELYRTLKNNSDEEAENRTRSPPVTSPSPTGRIYGNVPLKNGTSGLTNGILDYSNSFRSSSTAGTPDRGFRSPLTKTTVERVTSPALSKSSLGSVSGVVPSGARRGSSSNDDYSETVRITSKSDDPLHPSVTNTVQSFSKKTVPTKGGVSTETIESTETTTVTKSRSRPFGGDGYRYVENGIGNTKYSSPLRNGGATLNGVSGGVVIEVRPSRK